MVIATNLFKINKVSHKPRIFLHNYLLNNKIWKEFNFWENLIKYDIVEEMHNQKKYNLYTEENDLLKNIRIKDIVKAQINSNIYNMISFEVNTSLINKIINYFSNFYNLQKSVIDSLNQIINNSRSKRIELKEKKKLNSSYDFSIRNKNNQKSKNLSINNNTSKIIIKKNVFSLNKDFKIQKSSGIEPVKQDEQQIKDFFDEIDSEINKKNIFKDGEYNNILIMESKNKKNKEISKEKKEKMDKENDKKNIK